jgi:rod shape-determining protein MreC
MLGRVYLAGDHTSWVVLLTDINSRIPVSIQPKDIQAILAGDNSDAPNIEALAQGVKLKAGQEVVTSGDGGLLPPGLPVGVLVTDKGAFRVALFADPMATDEVRIVDFKNPVEQLPTPTIRDLPASAAGFKPSPPPAAPAPSAASNPSLPKPNGPPQAQPAPGPAPAARTDLTAVPGRSVRPDASKPPPRPPGPTGD